MQAMRARLIHTLVGPKGTIHIEDCELPPGPAELVVLYPDNEQEPTGYDVNKLPLGGHRAGWIEPRNLRREAMYEGD